MNKFEIVTTTSKADVLMAGTTHELFIVLRGLVAAGIRGDFTDLQWLLYHGPIERLLVESSPLFKEIISRLPPRPKVNLEARPDVIPGEHDSVRRMASLGDVGGGFYRVDYLTDKRFVLSPAQEAIVPRPELDLGYAVTFTGNVLVDAMKEQGMCPEIIDYRLEPGFPAYRERTIAQFFVGQTGLL